MGQPHHSLSYRNIDILTVIICRSPPDFRNELKMQYQHQKKKRRGTGQIEINLQYSMMGKKNHLGFIG